MTRLHGQHICTCLADVVKSPLIGDGNNHFTIFFWKNKYLIICAFYSLVSPIHTIIFAWIFRPLVVFAGACYANRSKFTDVTEMAKPYK